MRVRIAVAALSLSLLPALLPQARRNPDWDWPMWARDLKGTKFSPLKQITPQNVSNLKQAWSYRFNRDGKPVINGPSGSELYQEVTPIVVNGIMYTPAGDRVVALQPETGKELWSYELSEGLASFRGVAYWPGDRNNPPRVIFTSLKKMIGLNAQTGKIDPGFGKEGVVPLDVTYAGVPTIVGNMLFIGTNFYGPGMPHIGPQLDERGGQIPVQHGYDVRTGKELWEFHTFPRPGEVGYDTWTLPGSAENRTGNNVWAFSLTVDEANGLLYFPVSGPGANYYGGDRPGANLFGNSIVAVDMKTGKYKWHFQTVHHELWDYNLPPSPSLIDIRRNGRTIPALAQVGKTAYMYLLNRITGEPIYPIPEVPVTKSLVPKEVSFPTQPIPTKPPAIARDRMTKDDVVRPEDTTPEHAAACMALWNKINYYNDGPFTSFTYHEDGDNARPSIIFPGTTGGANWGGTAVDPNLGYVFVNTKESPFIGWLIKNPKWKGPGDLQNVEFIRSSPQGANFSAPIRNAQGQAGNAPCFRPPWGRMMAVNAATGEFAWDVPLGVNSFMPEGKQNTGSSNSAGGIATGGGLFFISGGTSDRIFRAFDSRTGKEVWSTVLPYVATAMPMTYQGNNGKQYVAIVAASGGAGGGRGAAPQTNNHGIYVFALP
jgi:quinoprotein glucose dehydrogenase